MAYKVLVTVKKIKTFR